MANIQSTTTSEENFRYFVFSNEQYKIRKDIEEKLGRAFVPGKVLINGQLKEFTEMTKNINNNRYSDMIVVAYGDKRNFKYTMPI